MLNIGGCEGACDEVAAAAGRHCAQLTALDASECQRLGEGGVAALARLEHLQVCGWV